MIITKKKVQYLVCPSHPSCFCTSGLDKERNPILVTPNIKHNHAPPKFYSMFLTWRWLLTCEIVSPLTSINWRTSFGVASEINPKKWSEIHHSENGSINPKTTTVLTMVASKAINSMNKATVQLRSPP